MIDASTQAVEEPKKKRKPWDETIRTILYAILIAVIFRSFLFEPFHIPSGSMKGNLLVGDYLFVTKYSYGYSRYSFPLSLPLFEGRIARGGHPKRGDVVVFRPPMNTRVDFIKRIIGLPGDKIQVQNGVVYINGKPVPRRAADAWVDDELSTHARAIPRYVETLPEGKEIEVLDERQNGEADNTPVYEVPAGKYFMMGDNRDNSRDSRYQNEIGFVPEENIVGRADLIFFSIKGNARIWEFWKWLPGFRLDRFFVSIE
jgi:signal peptidase I